MMARSTGYLAIFTAVSVASAVVFGGLSAQADNTTAARMVMVGEEQVITDARTPRSCVIKYRICTITYIGASVSSIICGSFISAIVS